MSCDYAVWFPRDRYTHEEAGRFYHQLCEGTIGYPPPHPAVEAFYAELIARWPALKDVPESRLGDHAYSPWSCSLDHSAGHVIMNCVWPQADTVGAHVRGLAKKHGLVFYDPQSERVCYPDTGKAGRAWWRFWS
jgi:hypothetical protein